MSQPPYPGPGVSSPASNGQGFVNLSVPRLLETFADDASMRDTPDLSAPMDQQLNIADDTTSEEFDGDDSLASDTSSEYEEVAPKSKGLPLSKLPTGLCYDDRMRYHAEISATTQESVHPEDPRRIYYIYKELCEAGLVNDPKLPPMVDPPLLRIDAREATEAECLLVHTKAHYDKVKGTSLMSDEELLDLSDAAESDSIYFNRLSYFCSKLSAGAAIETCRAVVTRKVRNAIAVIRPPGHHAEVTMPMGFCLFNNVCIASRVCQEDFGENCRKILILDWDVHHGNGCQKAFYNNPNILYISLHVHQNGMFYPSGPDGDMNVNIPWPTKGMGDGDYMYAFQHVVMPIATEFDPDFVIVASGFDAAAGDELGGCFVSPPCYAHMTHMLMSLANGKIAVCLEGGYNFSAISKSALAVTRTLMGEPPDRLTASQATQSAVETVMKVRQVQSQHWNSIYPKEPVGGIVGGERLHDVIRQWQAQNLYSQYRFTELKIFRTSVSKSFEKQVLATPNYENKRHLLMIFHDAPDLLGGSSSLTTQINPSQTWLSDGTQSYISWAVSHNFGVIDVNVPSHITVSDSSDYHYDGTSVPYASTDTDVARKEGEKLAVYLWENYVEPYAFSGGIFLMGCGNAFHAVARLITENESVYPQLLGVMGFLTLEPIRPVGSSAQQWLSSWYRDNSLVYVSARHSVWRKEGKISKRYGRMIKSEGSALNEMMKLNEGAVCKWMESKCDAGDETTTTTEEEEKEPKHEEDGEKADVVMSTEQ